MSDANGTRGARPNRWALVAFAGLALAGAAVYLLLLRGPALIAPPAPVTEADVYPPSEPPTSVLNVPLSVPLAPLVELIEEVIPERHGELDELRTLPDRDNVRVGFDLRREPLRAGMFGDVARLQTTVDYALRFEYGVPVLPDVSGSCGIDDELRPRVSVVLESPVTLTPDWRLATRTRLARVSVASPEERDRCEVTFLGLDVTDLLLDGVRSYLRESMDDIDSLATGVDTESRFASWWETLATPIRLDDSLWLTIGPEAVRRGPVRGVGDSLVVDLALTARPRVVVGPRPDLAIPPLPPLDTGDVVPRLDLLVDGRAEYGAASRVLNERIAGDSLVIEGRTVRIDALRVYGIGGGRLALELMVSGDVRARLYLTGKPHIDPGTGVISVPDLDFDVATRDVLVGTVAWLASATFRDDLRERARWPGDPAVEWLAGWLREGLNRELSDDLRVVGEVDSLRIVDSYALVGALIVRVAATGSARLQVQR